MTSKNNFVENNRTCHDLKRSCKLSGITGKYTDFSKIKLFRQRDYIDVTKKNGKEQI